MLLNMLPKYLLADNSQEKPGRLYVVHNYEPRFILEGSDEDFSNDQSIYWLDEEVTDEDQIDALIAGAEKFIESELDNQEELYDISMN